MTISGLRIKLPGGATLLRNINLQLVAGEVVVLVGGSGSGKSTLSRALFEPDQLKQEGFELTYDALDLDRNELGLVPQQGALFDHLTVGQNIELATRSRGSGEGAKPVADWLESVSLAADLAGAASGAVSGGQAQRIAVARALAAGREILFLDEPSVGLDPARVRELATVVRAQVERHRIAAIVVTHDASLAAGIADRVLFLDPQEGELVPLFEKEWPGALADKDETLRNQWLTRLENELVARIDRAGEPDRGRGTRAGMASTLAGIGGRFQRTLARPFGIAAMALGSLPTQAFSHPGDFLRVVARTAKQTLARPLPFYAVVAALIGYTILFVISKVGGAGVRPDALIRQIGGSYVLALAPPLSAILFVAASGAASNAWLGSITLTRQVMALEAIGVKPRAYLWAPTWLTIAISYLIVAALFVVAMIVGGWLLARGQGVTDAFDLLTADFLDPRPERQAHLHRAVFLFWIYAWGIASDVVAKGTAPKRDADSVTRSMTGSVVACTLWVVGWELVTAIWMFR